MDAAIATSPGISPAKVDGDIKRSRDQIDRIVYLASLASRREDIDDMMDILREVTARWDQKNALSTKDEASLHSLETQLKRYLIQSDPLRSFTSATLERRLQDMESRRGLLGMDPVDRSLLITALITLASAGMSFILPFSLTSETRFLLSIPLLFVALHLGIVWFYLTSLRNFKSEVRTVFIYFCIAAVIFAVGFSSYIVIELFDLTRYAAFRYAGISALFGIPFMLMYMGLRVYAQLLSIKARLVSLPFGLWLAAAILLPTALLPHVPTASETFFDVGTISGLMISVFAVMGSILANKIRHSATAAYAKPMTVLFWYMTINSFSSVMAVVALFIFGELQGRVLSIVLAVCGILPQSVLLYAGYLFKKETSK